MPQKQESFKANPNNKDKNRQRILAAILLIAIIGFPIILTIKSGSTNDDSNATNSSNEKRSGSDGNESTVDSSDLDLSIRPRVLSLGLENDEDDELINCEVRINSGAFDSGYKTRVSSIRKDEVNISYRQFTKKSERFDVDKYAVESVVVTLCDGQPDRMGIYGSE